MFNSYSSPDNIPSGTEENSNRPQLGLIEQSETSEQAAAPKYSKEFNQFATWLKNIGITPVNDAREGDIILFIDGNGRPAKDPERGQKYTETDIIAEYKSIYPRQNKTNLELYLHIMARTAPLRDEILDRLLKLNEEELPGYEKSENYALLIGKEVSSEPEFFAISLQVLALELAAAGFNKHKLANYQEVSPNEYVPVFVGPQHCGKSVIGKIIHQALFSDRVGQYEYFQQITRLPNGEKDKDIIDAMHSVAINEISEGAVFGRSNDKIVKSQVGKGKTKTRRAFRRDKEELLCKFVIYITSNEEKPLSDLTGNVRFIASHIKATAKDFWLDTNGEFSEKALFYFRCLLKQAIGQVMETLKAGRTLTALIKSPMIGKETEIEAHNERFLFKGDNLDLHLSYWFTRGLKDKFLLHIRELRGQRARAGQIKAFILDEKKLGKDRNFPGLVDASPKEWKIFLRELVRRKELTLDNEGWFRIANDTTKNENYEE